ncbi:MAG: TonB-dependent receptor [Rhodanobacteraceae bacterium]|nr:TonB-dependent receptor [Rhodanobacteraceae bacterium]
MPSLSSARLSASPFPHAAADAQDAPATDTLARVEVVGSRIKRVDVESSEPVIVLEREQLERSGLMSVGDILQDLTVHGAALNTTVNNGGDGTTRIDLRNLGPQRTLVLVDGRRWIPGIDGSVDLNSIALAVVERIEVLKDGASALYGSDAIAGVVNITTRKDFDGIEARAYYGESGHGDGRMQSYDASFGAAGERTRVSASLSYLKQAEIMAGDRVISAVPVFGLPPNDTAAGASAFTPNGLIGFGARGSCPYDPSGNYPGNGVCPRPGNRPPFQNRSTFDPASGGYRLFDPRGDGYNFAPENYLQTPQRRVAAFGNLTHALGEDTEFSLQLYFNERESEQRLAANPIMVGALLGGASRITVPANHVYNPFGQPVTGLAIRPGGAARLFSQDADTSRVAAGLDGSLEFAGRLWLWDADLVYGNYELDEFSSGLSDINRFALALGPSFRDSAGIARCGTPTAVIADCVPFDAFRGEDGVTPAMLDYLYYTGTDTTRTQAWNYHLGLSGDLIDLPAGPLAFAAGYEYRREEGEQSFDARRAALENLDNNDFGGEVVANEAYLELALPLLDGAPAAELLEASFAVRQSHYDAFGDVSTFEGGLRWKPVDQLLLRASYSEGFRAPIVPDLYFPGSESFTGFPADPCIDSNQPTPEQRANCVADGVPGGSYTLEIGNYRIVGGGNPDLQPETSTSRTLGFVWNPETLPGFDLSLDWYRIHVEDAISPVDPFELLTYCANAAVPEACARTQRDARGELIEVDGRLLNSGGLSVEGYDLSAGYRIDTDAGRFELMWDSTYYSEYAFEVPRGSGERSAVGHLFFLEPGFRLRSNLDLAWQREAFSAAVGIRYYSGLDEACLPAAATAGLCSSPDIASPVFNGGPENHLGSRTYVDLQAGWNSPWQVRTVVGVHNVFDRDPPVAYSGISNSFDPSYPIPGRFWYLQLIFSY